MTTLTHQPLRWRLRPFVWVLLALLLILPLSIPVTRRYLANPTGAAPVATNAIEVRADLWQNHLYAPAVVRVPVGTTVTWTFADFGNASGMEAVPHNVIGDRWGSPVLAEGTWQQTFVTPGTYRYTCTLHPGMDGVVIVE